jgi:hypothetical protein
MRSGMTGWMPKDSFEKIARLVGFTAGAALVGGLYLLVPLLLVLGPFIPENSGRLLVALGILAALELAVIRVLVFTTCASERGTSERRPVPSLVQIAGMHARSGPARFRWSGRAMGARLVTSVVLGLLGLSPVLYVLATAGPQAGPTPALAMEADTPPLEPSSMAVAALPAEAESPPPQTPTDESLSPIAPHPYCADGTIPSFQGLLRTLRDRLGDEVMGSAAECEHPNAENGDFVQATTTGLAFVRALHAEGGASDVPFFTNGWEHWALMQRGLAYWTGEAINPPRDADLLNGSVGPVRPQANPTNRATTIVADTTSKEANTLTGSGANARDRGPAALVNSRWTRKASSTTTPTMPSTGSRP